MLSCRLHLDNSIQCVGGWLDQTRVAPISTHLIYLHLFAFSAFELITFSFVSFIFIFYAFSFLIILNHFLVNNKQFTGEARKTNGLSAALTIIATLTTVLFAYITHITHGFTLFGVLWDLLKYFGGGKMVVSFSYHLDVSSFFFEICWFCLRYFDF